MPTYEVVGNELIARFPDGTSRTVARRQGNGWYLINEDGSEGQFVASQATAESVLNDQFESEDPEFGIFADKKPTEKDALTYFYAGQVTRAELEEWFGKPQTGIMLRKKVDNETFQVIQDIVLESGIDATKLPAVPLEEAPKEEDVFRGTINGKHYIMDKTGRILSSAYKTEGEADTALKTGAYINDIVGGMDVNLPAQETEAYTGYGLASTKESPEQLAAGVKNKTYSPQSVMNTLIAVHGYSSTEALDFLKRHKAVSPNADLTGISPGYDPATIEKNAATEQRMKAASTGGSETPIAGVSRILPEDIQAAGLSELSALGIPADLMSVADATGLKTQTPQANQTPTAGTASQSNTYNSRVYPDAVERWRPLVEQYFKPEDVDKALYVINYESGGNPDIPGDGGHAIGLFQHNDGGLASGRSLDALKNPEANIKLAAEAVYGGQGWKPWGENNLYQGKPFGALGHNPYTPPAGDSVTAFNTTGQSAVGAGVSAGGTPSGGGLIPFEEVDQTALNAAEYDKQMSAATAAFDTYANGLGTRVYRTSPTSGFYYDAGGRQVPIAYVSERGRVEAGQPGPPSSAARAQSLKFDGLRGTELERTAAVQGGLNGVVDWFRKAYPEFGPEYTPSFEEMTAALGSSMSFIPDATRSRNLGTLEATDGKFIYDDPAQQPGYDSATGTYTAPPTAYQQAQGLRDLYPVAGMAQESYINEAGQLIPGVPLERPTVMSQAQQDLYNYSPGLFTGQPDFTGTTGEEPAAGYSGLMFDPSDPTQAQRIADAVRNGTISDLQDKDATELAKLQHQATLASGQGSSDSGGGSSGGGSSGSGYSIRWSSTDKKYLVYDMYGKVVASFSTAKEAEMFVSRGGQPDFNRPRSFYDYAGVTTRSNPSHRIDNDPSTPRTDRPDRPDRPKPVPELPPVITPPPEIDPIGPFTTQPVFFAEGGYMTTNSPTAMVDMGSGQTVGVMSEYGQQETATITPSAPVAPPQQQIGTQQAGMPAYKPMPVKSLAQQGIGGIKAAPEMKQLLARAASNYRIQLELMGVSPLLAQELARNKMGTTAGQAKLVKENPVNPLEAIMSPTM